MFYLKMYIGKLLVAKYQLNYQAFDTVIERQTYQERVAAEMRKEHDRIIAQSQTEPVFFVENVESKINPPTTNSLKTVLQKWLK